MLKNRERNVNITKREMEENKTQMELLEMKNTISEIKKYTDDINRRLGMPEKKIGKLKTSQYPKKKEREKKLCLNE